MEHKVKFLRYEADYSPCPHDIWINSEEIWRHIFRLRNIQSTPDQLLDPKCLMKIRGRSQKNSFGLMRVNLTFRWGTTRAHLSLVTEALETPDICRVPSPGTEESLPRAARVQTDYCFSCTMFRMHKIHFSLVYILKGRPKSHFGNRRFKHENSTCFWKRKNCNIGINKSETREINLLVNLARKVFFMDPEYPYPDSQILAVGLYLNQLNPLLSLHRKLWNLYIVPSPTNELFIKFWKV